MCTNGVSRVEKKKKNCIRNATKNRNKKILRDSLTARAKKFSKYTRMKKIK